MKAVIIANGILEKNETFSETIKQAELIICADGGASHLIRMGILPHVIIGDLDSISPEDRAFFNEKSIEMIKYPSEKDVTDTELAAEFAMENKCNDITFLGVTGTRLDHTLANIFLLKKLAFRFAGQEGESRVQCKIIDDNNEIYIVSKSLSLKKTHNAFLSIIPLTETVEGVTTSGLKYPLTNAEMNFGSTLGISNQFLCETAIISVKKGVIIVIKSRD